MKLIIINDLRFIVFLRYKIHELLKKEGLLMAELSEIMSIPLDTLIAIDSLELIDISYYILLKLSVRMKLTFIPTLYKNNFFGDEVTEKETNLERFIRDLVRGKNLTTKELALRLGISIPTALKLRNNKQAKFNNGILTKVSEGFNITFLSQLPDKKLVKTLNVKHSLSQGGLNQPSFGRLIRTLRLQQRLTQKELAFKLGLSIASISNVEKIQVGVPSAEVEKRLLKYFNITFLPKLYDLTQELEIKNPGLAELMRVLRVQKGLTQKELGLCVNLSSNTILSLERDKCVPTSETLKKLSTYFNISLLPTLYDLTENLEVKVSEYNIGKFIRTLRIKQGLSKKELSFKIGCSAATITNLENMKVDIVNSKSLVKLSKYYKLSFLPTLFNLEQDLEAIPKVEEFNLGKFMRTLRIKQGLSRKELGSEIGFSASTIASLENMNGGILNSKSLVKLSKYYKLSFLPTLFDLEQDLEAIPKVEDENKGRERNIGNFISFLRAEHGLSQSKLSSKIGLSVSIISNLENMRVDVVNSIYLIDLSQHFKLSFLPALFDLDKELKVVPRLGMYSLLRKVKRSKSKVVVNVTSKE